MKRPSVVYSAQYILSFCSIIYAFILAQTVSALVGDTVLQYSVTFGLYMFAVGLGNVLAGQRPAERPLLDCIKTEIAATAVGGFAVPVLCILYWIHAPREIVALFSYSLTLIIGVLTGLGNIWMNTLRLSIQCGSEGSVRVWNYLGIFSGAVVFILILLPRTGLLPASFLVASLNASVICFLAVTKFGGQSEEVDEVKEYVYVVWILLGLMIVCALASPMMAAWLGL